MIRDIAQGDGDLTRRLVVASRDELSIRQSSVTSHQIAQGMSDLDATAQQAAGSAAATREAGQQLSDLACHLQDLVGRFRV